MIKLNLPKVLLLLQLVTILFLGTLIKNSSKIQVFILGIDLISVLLIFLKNKNKVQSRPIFLLVYFIVLFFLTSISNTSPSLYYLILILTIFSKYIIFQYCVNNLKVETLIKWILVFSGIIIGLCFLEVVSNGSVNIFESFYTSTVKLDNSFKVGTGNYVLRSSFEHPLVTSIILVILLPFSLLIKNKLIKYTFLLSDLFMIIIIQKRTAYILLFVLVLVFSVMFNKYILKKKMKRRSILLGLVGLFLFILISQMIKIQEMTVFQLILSKFSALETTDTFSLYNRTNSIFIGLSTIFNRNLFNLLFGNGLNFLPTYLNANGITIARTGFYVIDNSYVSILADFGIVNLLLFVGYSILTIIVGINNLKKLEVTREKILNIIAICGIVNILISIFFFDFYVWYSIFVLFILLQAIILRKRVFL